MGAHHESMAVIRAATGRWRTILADLGVSEGFLRNKHGPCPACGGKDRFRFDDKDGQGTWYCSQCGGRDRGGGGGTGLGLLMRCSGIDYCAAVNMVGDALGLSRGDGRMPARRVVQADQSNALKIVVGALQMFDRADGLTRDDDDAYAARRAEFLALTGRRWTGGRAS